MSVTYNIPAYSGGDEVITLIEAKAHLRITHDDEDTEIQAFIDSAVSEAESYMGGPILQRTGVVFGISGWRLHTKFPTGPVTAITEVSYLVADADDYVELDAEYYKLYNFGTTSQQITIREVAHTPSLEEDTLDAVRITATIGWTAATLPDAIKKAVLLMIDDAYTFRGEKELKMNRSSRNLLRPYKQF